MLTVRHPEVMPLVYQFPVGLLPLPFNGERPKLVIKVPKEAILAAKLNGGFKIYVSRVLLLQTRTIGFITAFFDDADEPLVTYSPLFSEPGSDLLRNLLLCNRVDIHLFDENSRELLGYEAKIQCPPATRELIQGARFLSFDYVLAVSSMDQMARWFGLRCTQDDLAAISIAFTEPLFGEDLFIQDMRPENHSYHGSKPFSYSVLERQEPGPFQERDIVKLLHRIFSPEQIYHGPLRTTDGEEIVDILVVTDSHALFIQAKDSPNTEQVLQNSLRRKKATAKKNLDKAISQVRGAMRNAKSSTPMKMIIDGKEASVRLDDLELRSLIVVKELFDSEYPSYSEAILSLVKRTEVPCIALEYLELHMFTTHLENADAFFCAFDNIFEDCVQNGVFRRATIKPSFID